MTNKWMKRTYFLLLQIRNCSWSFLPWLNFNGNFVQMLLMLLNHLLAFYANNLNSSGVKIIKELWYEGYICQLIQYFSACGSYHDFLDRGLLLTMYLLNQGLKSSRWKFYGHHHDLCSRYGISVINNHGYVTFVVRSQSSHFSIHDWSGLSQE